MAKHQAAEHQGEDNAGLDGRFNTDSHYRVDYRHMGQMWPSTKIEEEICNLKKQPWYVFIIEAIYK